MVQHRIDPRAQAVTAQGMTTLLERRAQRYWLKACPSCGRRRFEQS
jgi:hypothetical protein